MSEITRASGSAIQACGNTEVILLLETFLKEVRANPKIGYGTLILLEKGGEPHGGYAGDVQLEARAERAAMSCAEGIRDRVFNRVLPQRDPTVPADYVCYNVPSGSLSYDFLVWLIDAEMTRVREGAPPPLKVHFWYGRDGKAVGRIDHAGQEIDLIARDQFLRQPLGDIGIGAGVVAPFDIDRHARRQVFLMRLDV